MNAADRAIARAKSQIGTRETGKNITKYAADFDNKYPNFYNTKKQGAEWCDIFYDWCIVTEFGENIAREMLYQPWRSAGAGCKFSAGYYKNAKALYKTPQKGDQIFFYVGGEINHTGMVIDVSGTTVTTVEGNCGNEVRQNTYKTNNTKIAGYGRPNWSLADKKEVTFVTVQMPILQKGSKCAEVGTVQTLLNALGYVGKNGRKLTVDHDYGNNVDYAVQNFQRANGLTPDGIVGANTWPRLLGANY